MRAGVLVGLTVLAAVATAPAAADVRGSPDLEAALAENVVVPGEETTLDVTVTNAGDLSVNSELAGSQTSQDPARTQEVTQAQSVQAQLVEENAPVRVKTGTRAVGSLPEGGQASLPFKIEVPERAEPGTYTVELRVKYTYTALIDDDDGIRVRRTATERFELKLVIDGRAQFRVVDATTTAPVGADGALNVTIENTGSESAHATSLTLDSKNNELLLGGSQTASRFVGALSPGETTTVSYRTVVPRDAYQQRYSLDATTTFEGPGGLTYTSDTLRLGVQPNPERRFRIVDTSTNVSSGNTGLVAVDVHYTGGTTLTETTVTLVSENPGIRFGESSSVNQYVGPWEPNTTRTLVYDVTATQEADDRPYAVRAQVAYADADGDMTEYRPLSTQVTPAPEPELSLRNVSSTLRVGREGEVTGRVVNTGNTPLRNGVLRIQASSQNINLIENEVAVGTLRSGDSARFAYTIEVPESATPGPRRFEFVPDYQTRDGYLSTGETLVSRQQVAEHTETFTIETTNRTVRNDEQARVRVRITNAGEETVRDLSAKLFAEEPLSVSDSEAFIERLAPGQTSTATFDVAAAGAGNKTYRASLDIQYTDESGDTLLSDTYAVPVDVVNSPNSGGIPVQAIAVAGIAIAVAVLYLRRWR